VVAQYIVTGEPVGSRTVAKTSGLNLSPATIRNLMLDLEERGFLSQPHTSAGRIPTDLGYRYYVNYLMRSRQLTVKEDTIINEGLKSIHHDVEDALHQTLKVLSHLLEYASVVATLNDKTRVYSSGFSHMLKQPEFSDINYTRQLMETIEEEELMADIVREYTTEKGITIRIGGENSFKEIKHCSVVMSSYEMKDEASGGIGVIGPTRMSYARVASILDNLSRRLENIMEDEND
jgi:transcriptional regulator of heat shock response